VKHESCIAYLLSKIRTTADIESLLENGFASLREPMPPDVLKRIQAGLNDSDFTPNGVRAYFRDVVT
jgi:hypothetical protein